MEDNFIISSYRDGVRTIKINRLEKRNALCSSMYEKITHILNEDAENDKIVVTIITGTGDYFSSGNDITAAMSQEILVEARANIVKKMIDAFINYPKLLIAVVNGPAIGIGATMAVLCDIVYASERAVFDTNFVKLGICAEAASSLTFPYSLGRSKAAEVLLLNRKLSAYEAYQFGLISYIFWHSMLNEFIEDLHKYGKLPVNSLKINKRLIMANLKPLMSECNKREMEQLLECVQSEDFGNAVSEFLNRKSKL